MPTPGIAHRYVVLLLTNKSGGNVADGDVVIVGSANDDSFTTTTTAGYRDGTIGVAMNPIANNTAGRVIVSGLAPKVNVAASVTRGHFGKTHTVAKQATSSATRGPGTFCQFITGGTTPRAVLFGYADPDTGATPDAGDVAFDATGLDNTSATDVQAALEDFDAAITAVGGSGVGSPVRATAPATDLSTSSTSDVEISSSLRLAVTVLASGKVWVVGGLCLRMNSVGADTMIRIWVDGSAVDICGAARFETGTSVANDIAIGYVLTGLSAGAHTLSLGWQVTSSTVFLDGASRGSARYGSWWQALPI